jgi:PAS domain S-box-containing protein
MLAVSHDITLRRQAEALLLDSEQRLHQAASIAGLGFFDYDRRTNRVYWSDGTREILGMPRDATPGLAEALEWTHPDDRARCIAAIAQAKDPRGDGNVQIEYRIVRPDGEARRVSIRSQTQFEDMPKAASRSARWEPCST